MVQADTLVRGTDRASSAGQLKRQLAGGVHSGLVDARLLFDDSCWSTAVSGPKIT